MSRRGMTGIAWMIGLGALAGQLLAAPFASARAHAAATPGIEVTAPARPAERVVEPAPEPCAGTHAQHRTHRTHRTQATHEAIAMAAVARLG